jgi:hypothetical protein
MSDRVRLETSENGSSFRLKVRDLAEILTAAAKGIEPQGNLSCRP